MIACSESSSSHPEAAKLWDGKILRQLTRAGKGAIPELIRQSFGTSGPVGTGDVDRATLRVARYLERIVKGLFFHEYGEPLPRSYAIRMNLDLMWSVSSRWKAFAASHWERGHHFGNGVFSYWSTVVEEPLGSPAWLLLFYESIGIGCVAAAG